MSAAPLKRWKALQPHMRTALEVMSTRLAGVNIVVEIRDARLPFASTNFDVQGLIETKPKRVLLLNKADLASTKYRGAIQKALESPTCKVLYTSSTGREWASRVLSAIHDWLPARKGVGQVHVMMVAGVPNVGKSTFINALKRHAHELGLRKGSKVGHLDVGPLPGVTKQVLGFRVTDDPALVLIDTPGIMLPDITNSAFGFRMALAGVVDDTRVDPFKLTCFLLYVLSQPVNRGQLRATLAAPLPRVPSAEGEPARGGVSGQVSPQAELRRAHQCKRVAKVLLEALQRHDAARDAAQSASWDRVDASPGGGELAPVSADRHAAGGSTLRDEGDDSQVAWELDEGAAARQGEEQGPLSSASDGEGGRGEHGGALRAGRAPSPHGGAGHEDGDVSEAWPEGGIRLARHAAAQTRPRTAADFLAMMQPAARDEAGAAAPGHGEAAMSRSADVDELVLPELEHAAEHEARSSTRTGGARLQRGLRAEEGVGVPIWSAFRDEEWAGCAEEVVSRLSRQDVREDGEVDANAVSQAMASLTTLVRGGHLGRFLFEDFSFHQSMQASQRKLARRARVGG